MKGASLKYAMFSLRTSLESISTRRMVYVAIDVVLNNDSFAVGMEYVASCSSQSSIPLRFVSH